MASISRSCASRTASSHSAALVIAAAKPDKRDEVGALVDIQAGDEGCQFTFHGIVRRGLENVDLVVVGGV